MLTKDSLNDGMAKKSSEPLGYDWIPLNGAKPIASGAAPAANVKFGRIIGYVLKRCIMSSQCAYLADFLFSDDKADYIVVDPKTGKLDVWRNMGPDEDSPEGWKWQWFDADASGLGPGKNVRIADIDGDGVSLPQTLLCQTASLVNIQSANEKARSGTTTST